VNKLLEQGGTFEALRSRDFRWYWLGRVTSLAAFQMDGVAQGWLVYELTGSAVSLGWVSACRSISMLLFSLYGGVISDRVPKRDVLVWTRLARLLTHLAVAVLISTGSIRVWHLAVRSLLSGVFIAIVVPAERAIVPELVDRPVLLNAVSLTAIATGLMGILAAWVAGFTIEAIGVGGVYYAIVAFHVLTALVVAQLPSIVADRSAVNSVWADLVEGVRYVFRQRALVPLMALALAVVLFGRPYRTLMPKFAKDVMGFEAAGLGLLMAAPEVGSLVSSLAVASLGDFRGKGRLLLAAGVALGASLLLYAHVQTLALVLLFLALVGAASNISQVTSQTLVQSGSTDRFQGRVASLYMVLGGLTPLGTMPAGVIADRLGVPAAVGIEGVLLVLIFGGMVAWGARVRRME